MKKPSSIFILTAGILLFFISYNFDQQIASFFKDIELPIFDSLLSTITNFGVVMLAILGIPSLVLYKKNKGTVYLLWITFFVSVFLAFVLKLIFSRQRPMDAFTYPFTDILNYSFPSMHAMAVFSLLPILVKYIPKQKHFWALFGLLAVFSRIYLGFHFLSDAVFGALLGYFIGNLILGLHEKRNS